MTTIEQANLLLSNGIYSPAQIEKIQQAMQTDFVADSSPVDLAGFAVAYAKSENISTPSGIEPVSTLVLCRGQRTDTLNY